MIPTRAERSLIALASRWALEGALMLGLVTFSLAETEYKGIDKTSSRRWFAGQT